MGVTPFYEPDSYALVYHVVPDLEPTCPESASQSDAGTDSTGMTIQTEDLPDYFVQHHGHLQPANENIPRWFPADNIRRYMLRYLVNKWTFGGLAGPVSDMLAPVAGRQRHALELGTRTGTWIQETAHAFPHVQFRSLDVVPIIPHIPRSNIVFEVYDFTAGILLEDDSQDAVFLNHVFEMVSDYRALLREVHRVLRPGGLIYINDFNPHLWDPLAPSVPARRTHPVGCHLFDRVRARIAKLGLEPDTCDALPSWLAPDAGLWDPADPTRGFEHIRSVVKVRPEGKPDERTDPFLAHFTVMSIRDMASLLRDGGMGEAEAERLIEAAVEEMRRPEGHALLKLYCVYASKRFDH